MFLAVPLRQLVIKESNPKISEEEEEFLSELFNPDESKRYQKVWFAEQNQFVFCHANLGLSNIKIIDNKKRRIILTGLLDWEIARFFPKRWIFTKFYLSGGLGFDWNGKEGWNKWLAWLRMLLERMGYQAFPRELKEWEKNLFACLH